MAEGTCAYSIQDWLHHVHSHQPVPAKGPFASNSRDVEKKWHSFKGVICLWNVTVFFFPCVWPKPWLVSLWLLYQKLSSLVALLEGVSAQHSISGCLGSGFKLVTETQQIALQKEYNPHTPPLIEIRRGLYRTPLLPLRTPSDPVTNAVQWQQGASPGGSVSGQVQCSFGLRLIGEVWPQTWNRIDRLGINTGYTGPIPSSCVSKSLFSWQLDNKVFGFLVFFAATPSPQRAATQARTWSELPDESKLVNIPVQ